MITEHRTESFQYDVVERGIGVYLDGGIDYPADGEMGGGDGIALIPPEVVVEQSCEVDREQDEEQDDENDIPINVLGYLRFDLGIHLDEPVVDLSVVIISLTSIGFHYHTSRSIMPSLDGKMRKDPEGSVSALEDGHKEDRDCGDRTDENTDEVDGCVDEHCPGVDVLDDGIHTETVAEEYPKDSYSNATDQHENA